MLPAPASRKDAPSPFVLVADDVLAHMLFLPEAFRGPSACSWEGQRAYLFDVAGAGQYLVGVDATDAGLGASVLPYDPDLPAEARPKGGVVCTVLCLPAELLTMLAGGAAELTATDLAALQAFLKAFDFAGYPTFCERRHLRAWPVPKERSQRSSDRLSRSLGSLATGLTGASRRASTALRASFASGGGVSEDGEGSAESKLPIEATMAAASPSGSRRGSVEGFESIDVGEGSGGGSPGQRRSLTSASTSGAFARMRSVSEEALGFAAQMGTLQIGSRSPAAPKPKLTRSEAKAAKAEAKMAAAAAALEQSVAGTPREIDVAAVEKALDAALKAGMAQEDLSAARAKLKRVGQQRIDALAALEAAAAPETPNLTSLAIALEDAAEVRGS